MEGLRTIQILEKTILKFFASCPQSNGNRFRMFEQNELIEADGCSEWEATGNAYFTKDNVWGIEAIPCQ